MKLTLTRIALFAAVFMFVKSSFGQHEISSSAGLEIPMANLTWVYKPTLSYNLSYYKMKRGWQTLKGGLGGRIGYYNFQSGGESLDYMTFAGPGKATFSDYSVLMVALCTKWNYEFNNDFVGYFGLDVGYYYSKYRVEIEEPGQLIGATSIDGKFAVAPKLGVAYSINDDVGLFVQTRYNLAMRVNGEGAVVATNGGSTAHSSNDEYYGQTDFGSAISVWSTNVGIYYKFRW